jgi:hypothetical protein
MQTSSIEKFHSFNNNRNKPHKQATMILIETPADTWTIIKLKTAIN